MGAVGGAIAFGYDSYNKLVYWTEQIPVVPLPSPSDYSFAVFGWDGKTNAVVTYFAAANTSTSVGQVCTYNGTLFALVKSLSKANCGCYRCSNLM